MWTIKRLYRAGAIASCIAAVSACGLIPSKEVEYKQAKPLPPLEVPPDLITPAVDASAIMPAVAPSSAPPPVDNPRTPPVESGAGSLPSSAPDTIRVERDGAQRWLVVKSEPAALWQKMRGFWQENGLTIAQEQPSLGILDTNWEENRAKKGEAASFFRKSFDFLRSSSTRDQFRVRLESGVTPGTTEVYLAHRGMEQVARGDAAAWQPRPSDPELEAEMLTRLALYLGTSEAKAGEIKGALTATPPERATLNKDAQGQLILTLAEDYANAWRRTAQAIDRLGLKVDDQDRTKGIYQVRFSGKAPDKQEKGFFSRLFAPKEDKEAAPYQLSLSDHEGKETRVIVLDMAGNRDNSAAAQRLLTLLHERLK
ncbi:MAG: outer membrane protein assembly factor BamC [Gammaproteobacteria bacterium]|nr:outer membrane protein assembly factor BamC [Gammaproteobacteria bacterium]